VIALIAAVAENGVIGRAGGLPWRLSGDLKHFKAVTLGKPVVMGRKTFQSIGKPLPGRTNIVVTRDPDFRADGIETVPDLAAALERAQEIAGADGEVMVIGGGDVYRQALPSADRLYLTEVHAAPDGDAHFPAFDRAGWREASRTRHQENGTAYSFVVLERAA